MSGSQAPANAGGISIGASSDQVSGDNAPPADGATSFGTAMDFVSEDLLIAMIATKLGYEMERSATQNRTAQINAAAALKHEGANKMRDEAKTIKKTLRWFLLSPQCAPQWSR